MSIHKLYEQYTDGSKLQIGGTMTQMRIGAVNGGLSEISVDPVPVEQMHV